MISPNVSFLVSDWPDNLVASPPDHRTAIKNILDPFLWTLSRPRLARIAKAMPDPGQLNRRQGFGWYKWLLLNQIDWEIRCLLDRVTALQPRTIIEIGTSYGGSFLLWAAIASKKVISLDLPQSRQFFIRRQKMWHLCLANYPKKTFTFVAGDSHSHKSAGLIGATLDGEKADFLFIDADHSEAGVTQDYEMYRDFIRKGGLIAFHDIVKFPTSDWSQVDRFWQKVKLDSRHEEIIKDPDQGWGGIGLILC